MKLHFLQTNVFNFQNCLFYLMLNITTRSTFFHIFILLINHFTTIYCVLKTTKKNLTISTILRITTSKLYYHLFYYVLKISNEQILHLHFTISTFQFQMNKSYIYMSTFLLLLENCNR